MSKFSWHDFYKHFFEFFKPPKPKPPKPPDTKPVAYTKVTTAKGPELRINGKRIRSLACGLLDISDAEVASRIKFYAENGWNELSVWLLCPWGPHIPLPCKLTSDGRAVLSELADGKPTPAWNPEFWNRCRLIAKEAAKNKVGIVWVIMDGWSLRDDNPQRYHPLGPDEHVCAWEQAGIGNPISKADWESSNDKLATKALMEWWRPDGGGGKHPWVWHFVREAANLAKVAGGRVQLWNEGFCRDDYEADYDVQTWWHQEALKHVRDVYPEAIVSSNVNDIFIPCVAPLLDAYECHGLAPVAYCETNKIVPNLAGFRRVAPACVPAVSDDGCMGAIRQSVENLVAWGRLAKQEGATYTHKDDAWPCHPSTPEAGRILAGEDA